MAIIGRVISAGIQEFRASCLDGQGAAPGFGGLVWTKMGDGGRIYAIVTDLSIAEDALIGQIARSFEVENSLMWDNRRNRSVAVIINAVVVGFCSGNAVQYRIPSHPPAVLEVVERSSIDDTTAFCASGSYDYLRYLVRQINVPRYDLLAAHFAWMNQNLEKEKVPGWREAAVKKINSLLQSDPECFIRLLEILSHMETACL
jgi:hypothetical protein